VEKSDPRGDGPGSSPSRLPRGRHGLPRDLVAENQRRRLIAGVISAVAERGYPETTIAAIIEAAALSRKTFYEHYENKEACFAAAYEASFEFLREEIEGAADAGRDWGVRVRARVARLLGLLAAEPDLAAFFFIAPTSAGDSAIERHHRAMRELVTGLTEGSPESPGEALATREQALAGGISRLVVRKLGASEATSLPELLPALVELVLRPYVGGEEAVRIAEED
jgi:AcrR family transcriptional regulator